MPIDEVRERWSQANAGAQTPQKKTTLIRSRAPCTTTPKSIRAQTNSDLGFGLLH